MQLLRTALADRLPIAFAADQHQGDRVSYRQYPRPRRPRFVDISATALNVTIEGRSCPTPRLVTS